MAHLKALETVGDNELRYRWKLLLIKRLYKLGYGREDVVRLFQFIDWAMSLPDELEEGLWREIQKIEEETRMEYVTSVRNRSRFAVAGLRLKKQQVERSPGLFS